MKITPFHPQILRSFAAAVFALLAVSCDKPTHPQAKEKAPRALDHREARMADLRSPNTRTSGYHWNTGDTASYTIELNYSFGNPSNGSAPGASTSGLVIRGNYHLAVLAEDGGTVTLAAAMSNARVLQRGEKSPIFENLIHSTPAILTLSREGAVQQITFAANVPDEDRRFLQAIYGWEFQTRSGAKSWTAKETEASTGSKFNSTYTTQAGSVTKVRASAGESTGPLQEVSESKFVGKTGKCWLDSLKGHEVTTLSEEGKTIGETCVEISLERSQSTILPEVAMRLLASPPKPGEFTLEPTEAAKGVTPAVELIRITMLREKYNGVPYELPFKALEKVSESGSHADSLQALHDLSDFLQVHPELAPRVAESLKSGVSPRFSALLAHSLELANNEATQKTLATILSNPGEYTGTVLAQSIIAAGGLGTLKDPAIADALDQIQSSYGSNQDEYPLSDAALFSMSRLALANPELQKPLVDVLTPMMSGDNDEARRTAVLALANARLFNPELIDLAQNLLTSGDPQTRAAALSYFEVTPDLGNAQILSIAARLKDENGPVQLQAVATLTNAYHQNGSPESLAALKAITHDSTASPDVRDAAQHTLQTISATARN